ncbi:MAG: transcriptional regulator PhoU [Euryarchaeota archaeon ADurb.BinA087]|nr:AbrB/MazE/SpoVT family DNA-binding domain-containing protein [Methanoregulaceae archaeon]OPZ42535.1 MAG: transcriptional regulator PhoU [Euryarchaeota archaeon ADurb.BinA087]HPX73095.1 PhoU domain-containing protein [Methanoregulaceae archaeon]HQA79437.1 PhoU domain-containing protein [Methanoregulaceae archaeon]
MEIRKVQITGGSSYVITLPKEWIEEQNIHKNDPLGFLAQPDGTLLITRDITEGQFQREKVFSLADINEPVYLFRLLVGSYISGFTGIRITSKTRIPVSMRMVAREFTQMAIGFEVVEETDMTIILKDLLNPSEMPFENTIKRMFVIVKNMQIDAMSALENGVDPGIADDVIKRDNDVDRLNWLIARQTNMILKNARLSRKMGAPTSKVVNTYIISRIIERIGDHAVRIAENVMKISGRQIDKDLLTSIMKANTLAISLFDKSIVSFFNSDLKASNKNIEQVEKLEELYDKIALLAMKEEPSIAIPLRSIAESIRRSGEYAGDISESIINYLIEEKP